MENKNRAHAVEILAPGGSYESIIAALNSGADAIYTGGGMFGARAYADNLNQDRLIEIIDAAHLRGKKIYLTVNTLLKQKELQTQLIPYLKPYYEAGLDAVLVQDFGVLSKIREAFPDLPIHASTQMTVLTPEFSKWLKQFGVTRVVPARELSLAELRKIKDEVDIEVETFVHGALCYCYSGQCLMSSMIGGRSGNRGRCAQPCRLPYQFVQDGQNGGKDTKKPAYLLSLNDLCTLDLIPDMVDAGIDSFKIEGRMKGPEYAALVTSLYKKYTMMYLTKGRNGYRVDAEDIEALMDLYNRGGFSKGYYQCHNDKSMITFERSNHKGTRAAKIIKTTADTVTFKALEQLHGQDVLEIKEGLSNQDTYAWTLKSDIPVNTTFTIKHRFKSRQHDQFCYRTKNQSLLEQVRKMSSTEQFKEKIKGNLKIFKDLPAKLILSYGNVCVEVEGQVVQPALNRAMTEDEVRKHMQKTGDTPYVFDTLDVEMDADIFMPVAVLKQLRRDAITLLEARILAGFRRTMPGDAIPGCKVTDSVWSADSTRTVDSTQIADSTRATDRTQTADSAWKSDNAQMADKIQKTNKVQADNVCSDQSLTTDEAMSDELTDIRCMTVLVSTQSQFDTALRYPEFSRIYINDGLSARITKPQLEMMVAGAHDAGKEIFLALPSMLRHEENDRMLHRIKLYGEMTDGVLVRSVEGFLLFKEAPAKFKRMLDCNVYTWNQSAKHFWKGQQADELTVPEELNFRELSERGCAGNEMIVYGYRPLMTTAQCLTKTTGHCQKSQQENTIGWLTDRKDKHMMVERHCEGCYNTIYNSQVLMLLDELDKIRSLDMHSVRLEFTTENQHEMKKVIDAYKKAWLSDGFVTDMQKSGLRMDFTKGHFKRGVE